jgi:CDP-diacylglycerol--serine O-phosphatidyltransferase
MKNYLSALPDLVSLVNGFTGLLAIMYIIDGEFHLGMILILLGVLIDGTDGLLAGYLRKEKVHGVYLDSIADMVTFCFAPSILLYGVFYDLELGTSFQSIENALTVAASMLVVLFGIMRLARFIERGHKEKNFIGLPTPASAVFIVLCVFVIPSQFVVLPFAIIISFLMISELPYPKLAGPLMLGAGALIVLGIFSLWLRDWYSMPILSLVLAMASIYVLIGPLYAKTKKGELSWI